MANIKITDLNAYSDPASTDVLPIVDVGADETKKVSIADLMENAGAGTEALPGIAFDGDPNTGIYSPGADTVGVSTAGTERLRIDSAGNVGIGTSSPGSKLEVADGSGIFIRDTGGTERTTQLQQSGSAFYVDLRDGASNGQLIVRGKAGGSPTERLRIDSAGNVGIGTTSPNTLLELSSGSTTSLRLSNSDTILAEGQITGQLQFYQSDATAGGAGVTAAIRARSAVRPDTGTYDGTCADLGLYVSGRVDGGAQDSASLEALTIKAGGNVGIGTTSPTTQLTIGEPNNATVPLRLFSSSSTNSIELVGRSTNDRNIVQFYNADGTTAQFRIQSTNALTQFTQELSADLSFGTNNTEAMRIDSSGNVGIGTSSPRTDLDVAGNIYMNGNTQLQIATTANTAGLQLIGQDAAESIIGTMSAQPLALRTAAVERLRIDSAGYLRLASGSGGIQFNGDTAAANALDDYEEGTWTPQFTDGTNNATMAAGNIGKYTKIGNTVHAQCDARCSALGSMTGGVRLSGLPFSGVSLYTTAGTIGGALGLNITAGQSTSAYIPGANSYLLITLTDAANGSSILQASELSDDGQLFLNVTYQVS